jgi:nucleoside-diphosphate-sugar epimerase
MIKVLITGATGFVGSHITKRLAALDYEVHAIIRKSSNIEVLQDIEDKIRIYTYDGTINSMMEILETSKPDIVIHLAAFFIAEHSSNDIDSLFFSNILFGVHLLEAMNKAKVSFMINTGTHWQHYNDEEFNPVDLYAATKKAFEDIGKYYTQSTPLRMIH